MSDLNFGIGTQILQEIQSLPTTTPTIPTAGVSNASSAGSKSQLVTNPAPQGFNKTAYNKLQSASKASNIEAVLLDYSANGTSQNILYTFGVNPANLEYGGITAEYSAIPTISNDTPNQSYNYSNDGTLNINDMILNTYLQGKSLRPLVEGLTALTKSNLANNKYAPKILTYRMGTEKFEPCVITSVKWTREASLGGEPARIKLSLTLLKVPKPISQAQQEANDQKRQQDAIASNIAKNQPGTPLSLRQQNDAQTAAKAYLTQMLGKLDANTAKVFKSQKYTFNVNATTGAVDLIDNSGNDLGIIVQSSGKLIQGGTGFSTFSLQHNQNYTSFSQTLTV